MKLSLTTNEGTLINIWEDIDEQDLSKGMLILLLEEIKNQIEIGLKIEAKE